MFAPSSHVIAVLFLRADRAHGRCQQSQHTAQKAYSNSANEVGGKSFRQHPECGIKIGVELVRCQLQTPLFLGADDHHFGTLPYVDQTANCCFFLLGATHYTMAH